MNQVSCFALNNNFRNDSQPAPGDRYPQSHPLEGRPAVGLARYGGDYSGLRYLHEISPVFTRAFKDEFIFELRPAKLLKECAVVLYIGIKQEKPCLWNLSKNLRDRL